MQRRVHENSLANLQRFQPGQSGNPGGRRKGVPSITHAIERIIALSPAELKAFKPSNQAEVIALQRIKDAARELNPSTASAQMKATEMIMNRVDGPVERRVVIENPNEFQSRLRQARAFWAQIRENLHLQMCEAACVCLTDEQIVAAVLAGYPDSARPAVADELALIIGQ
jgi:hypothetical protein